MAVDRIDRAMQAGVDGGVFPGAVLLCARGGSPVVHRAYGAARLVGERSLMTPETVFDIASLTKALGTTVAAMLAVDDGSLLLDEPLGRRLPLAGTALANLTAWHLLGHCAGLPAWLPLYRGVLGDSAPDRAIDRSAVRREIRIRAAATHLAYRPGTKAVYSDLGFIVLDWLLEEIHGDRLDRVLAERIFAPLGLTDMFFIDLDASGPPPRRYAATEVCGYRKRLLQGEVHDQNSFAMGGVAGQAGLFATAQAVHAVVSALWACFEGRGSLVARTTLGRFWRRTAVAESDFALGWDTPRRQGYSSAGTLLSREAVGHLGFTGCSLWLDPERGFWVVLLTNRIHPSVENRRIVGFRPHLHDLLVRELRP